MALNTNIVTLIRDEIGPDPDFSNNDDDYDPDTQLGSLESIYTSSNRGNSNVLRSALICWRLRYNDYVKRGFDSTSGGSLMARRQRLRELIRIVKEYELLIDTTLRSRNVSIRSDYQRSSASTSEF